MKKNLFFIFALVSAAFITSCQDFKPAPEADGGLLEEPKGEMTVMTPDEQKNYLVKVGEELIKTFKPEDQKPAVDLAEDLYNKYKDYNWDNIGEEFDNALEDIYSAEFESFFGMPKRVIDMMNGKHNASLEDLQILLTLSKFGHLIEFDDANKTVKITKTNDPSIIAKFSDSKGTKCEFKVLGEGKTINGSYTYEDYHWESIWNEYGDWMGEERVVDGHRTIKVEVPTTIKMHLKQGNEDLVSMNFTWDSNLKDYINTSLNLTVLNLGFNEEVKANTKNATGVFSFTYNNKGLIAAAFNLPKYEFIDWEGGNDITPDDATDWSEEFDEKYASLLGKIGSGEIKLDILGKIQLKGGVTDGAALVDAYNNWGEKYHPDYLTECQELSDLLNKYLYISLYYNNTTTEQAKILTSVCEQPYGYEVEPIMYFPQDQTSIAVMTYFNSSKFLGLIDIVEEVANSYIKLDKNHHIFGEDFQVELD